MAKVHINGHDAHIQRLGQGAKTVVFIHGLVMDNLSSWYFTAANPMAEHARVLLYDLRGHGRSERTPTGYSVDELVTDLSALLEHEVPSQKVAIVGNSFGGLLALAFALKHPESVEQLVLVDAHWSEAGWADDMLHTLGLQGAERDLKIMENFQHWLGRHSARKRNRLARLAEALVHDTSLLRDLQTSESIHPEALRNLTCPVLALYGEQSDIIERGRRLADQLPDCTLDILPGCSHSIIWEATETLKSRIVDWLRGGWTE